MNQRLIDALSIGGTMLMVAGLLLLLSMDALLSELPVVIGFQVIAVALMIWARITFGRRSFHLSASATEGALVTTGPYKFIRHPIYAAILMFVFASVAGHLSVNTIMVGLLTLAGALSRVLCEEHSLRREYPEYAEYAAATRRFIPFVF